MKNNNGGFFHKIFGNRYGMAAFYVVIAAVLTFSLGFVISLILGDGSLNGFWRSSLLMFWIFFAGAVVAAVLLVITSVPVDLSFGFGYGLYYGTLGVAILLDKLFLVDKEVGYIIGFVLSALVSYIIWLKKYKAKYQNPPKA